MKNNLALKCFAILIFTLELLAPAFLSAQSNLECDRDHHSVHRKTDTVVWLTGMLYEEAGGEEEKDGKENPKIFFISPGLGPIQHLNLSSRLVTTSLPKGFSHLASGHLSLFSIYRNFRI